MEPGPEINGPRTGGNTTAADTTAGNPAPPPPPSTAELLELLRQDRQWLLRQIDSGRWSPWRLDLAALERELGQLLEQAEERLVF